MLLQLLKGAIAKADDNNFTESYQGHLAEPLLMATSGLAQVSLPRLVLNIHKCAYCLICCWPVQSEHARGEIKGQRTSVLMTQAARRSYLLHDLYMRTCAVVSEYGTAMSSAELLSSCTVDFTVPVL